MIIIPINAPPIIELSIQSVSSSRRLYEPLNPRNNHLINAPGNTRNVLTTISNNKSAI